MTALVVHVSYNNLTSLEEANISRQALPVDDIGPIRDVFLKLGAHIALCLYLQHHQHIVGADEAVVKVEGTAQALYGFA